LNGRGAAGRGAAAATHRIASILDLLTLSDQALEDAGTLLLCLESDALAFLQASGAILEDCSAG